jgi:hypothetical protein
MSLRDHIFCSSRSSGLPLLASCLCLTILPVVHAQDVLTYHNDNARTAQNLNETILTTANVNSTTFGKLFTLSVDGKVDAQPLYRSALAIPGKGTHNVLFVATENDSVYAFDADTGALLWHVSLLPSGETTATAAAVNCDQVTPVIGITATPVIDRTSGPNGTIYAVAMSQDAAKKYHHRLHALDVTTGQEEFSGPVEIAATFPSTGPNSHNGAVVFDPRAYKERPALLLVNHVVYTTWASHCDITPYNGWIIGYNEASLTQANVLNLTPNGTDGAVWSSGGGPAGDASGNIYLLDANGTFDTTLNATGFPTKGDYGNGFLKLAANGSSLTVADYFNMSNTNQESGADTDLGSGAAMLLPDLTNSSGVTKHLAIGAGKDTNIYLVDRDNMGKFNPNSNPIYQQLLGALPGGIWSVPAYFNKTVYYGPVGHPILAFQLSNALLVGNPVSQTSHSFGYPGASPSISANQNTNGILWAAENSSPAILHAYDATNLSHELYNSNQAPSGRDQFGTGNKFITPTIANGKVYVGTTSGVGVFGILTVATPTTTTLSSSLNPSALGQQVTFTATVTSTTGTPTGTVTFDDGATAIGSGVLDGTGKAAYATSTLSATSHFITAVYPGDASHGASTSTVLTQVVIGPGATVTAAGNPNPSTFGQPVTLSAAVKSAASPTPTGTVTFQDTTRGFTVGTATLNGSGNGSITTAPTTLRGGPHNITVTYSGDKNYATSSGSFTQTVNKAPTSTTIVSSANPSASGTSVTFTATVTWTGPEQPMGNVQFKDGGTVIATVALSSAGVATFTTTTLTVGTHSIAAHYRGTVTFASSNSPVLSQTVH